MPNKRRNLLVCGQCSDLTTQGTVDPEDGIFYCFTCWEDFGGVPADAKWTNCVLCKKAKPEELFSKTQRKKRKPICLECTPRRVADAAKKQQQLHVHVDKVNALLKGGDFMFEKLGADRWTLLRTQDFLRRANKRTHIYTDGRQFMLRFEALVGVNNMQDAGLYIRQDDLWEVTVGEKVTNFVSWPPDKKEGGSHMADFALTDKMLVYSLNNVVNMLAITFIFSPSLMYDVRQKYTLGKMRVLLSKKFDFSQKLLQDIQWPVQIYLEQFIDCSEAVSNEILQFTGEVLVQCTFKTAALGTLFTPWDTWEADLGIMGDYKKTTPLREHEAVATTTGEEVELTSGETVKEEVTIGNAVTGLMEESQADGIAESKSPTDMEKSSAERSTSQDSFENVEACI